MNDQVFLTAALHLPVADLEALAQGQTIVAIPQRFINPGQTFALYSSNDMPIGLPLRQHYRSGFLPIAQAAVVQQDLQKSYAQYWARCELCQVLDHSIALEDLSNLTVWTKEVFQERLQQQSYIFLAYLRVYELGQKIEVNSSAHGHFIPLPEPQMVNASKPVLNDQSFNQRKRKLEKREPPIHFELEELQSTIAQLFPIDLKTQLLVDDVRKFLGWSDTSTHKISDPDLVWIQTIADVGNSSDGELFEKLVRRGLVKLGFTNSNSNPQASLDPSGCGGAGGLDFYCQNPYQVVGECKATRTTSVPDSTPSQLVRLGLKHLQAEYENCIKIIMAAGELNSHAKQTAIGSKMNVLRPETLQRLVQLKANFPGSIDLIALKPCLESSPFGEDADVKIHEFINKIEQSLKVRSHLLDSIRQLAEIEPDRKQFGVIEIRTQYNSKFKEIDGKTLDNETVYELLIELSSPLVGCLGRVKVSGVNSDCFYYLRDLVIH